MRNKQIDSSKSYNSKKTAFLADISSYIKIALVAVIIAYISTHYIIVNANIPSESMNNTIMKNDRLIGFRFTYLFSNPQRGDIVIFKFPDDESELYIKRVIGTPGDVIEITDGHVYANGELLVEDYIKEPMTPESPAVYVVPDGYYFMMGDNRNFSKDSRRWTNTYVAKDKILGKAIFKYYNGFENNIDFEPLN